MKKFFTHLDPILPVHHPRVLVETAVRQGADRARLLAEAELTEAMLASPDTRISYLQFAALVRSALKATGNPSLGLDMGRNVHMPQMGMLGLAVMSSKTIGDALRVALRHTRTLSPCFDLELRVEGERAVLVITEAISLEPFRAFSHEALLAALDTQARSLIGRPVPMRRLKLAFPRPEYADRYKELQDAPMLFDQDVTELEFDAAALDLPVPYADPATAKLAEQFCEERLSTERSEEGLIAQVRSLLGAARGRPPDLRALAKSLQTSSRSLRRYLQDMGTSYRELLDELREARAKQWAASTEMTFEQMAEQLGFSDVRSFRRAFKRWTGKTPGEFRQALH